MQDYDETYPESRLLGYRTVYFPLGYNLWTGTYVTQPYIKNKQVLLCPDDGGAVVDPSIIAAVQAARRPVPQLVYAKFDLSPYYVGSSAFGVANPQGIFEMDNAYSYGPVISPTTLAGVNHPSDVIMFCDGKRDFQNWWCGTPNYEDNEVDWCFYSNIGFYDVSYIQLCILAPQLALLSNSYTGRLTPVFHKHTGISNFAMSDGHSKALQANSLNDGSKWLANWPN